MTKINADKPETAETDIGSSKADADVESDPARGGEGVDWSDEGGATPSGPAT